MSTRREQGERWGKKTEVEERRRLDEERERKLTKKDKQGKMAKQERERKCVREIEGRQNKILREMEEERKRDRHVVNIEGL